MTGVMVRRDPFDLLRDVFHWPRRWSGFLGDSGEGHEGGRMIVPAMDVVETDDAISVTAELPGMKKEDVKITIEGGVLSLSGEKKIETEEKKSDYHRVERSYGSFHRSFSLPSGVDGSKAQAAFQDGVLTIRIPKAEAAKPRQIEIR